MKPEPGQIYRARGYLFRIVRVEDCAVSIWWWKEGNNQDTGWGYSVPLQDWEREMEGVEPCQISR
jgi:hypothetical protein